MVHFSDRSEGPNARTQDFEQVGHVGRNVVRRLRPHDLKPKDDRVTLKNSDFRRVLYTAGQMQVVLMKLKPGEAIGEEVHETHDQFFRIEKGRGEAWLAGKRRKIKSNAAIVVPAGVSHDIKNTGKKTLKLYTIYAPPEHADGVVQATKPDAEGLEEKPNGRTLHRRREQRSAKPANATLA